MKINEIVSGDSHQVEQLVNQLKDELNIDRHDNYGDLDTEKWVEASLDAPTQRAEQLQREIMNLVGEDKFEQIMDDVIVPYMYSL